MRWTADAFAQLRAASGKRYLETTRAEGLSVGIYGLPAGAQDLQQPHDEDEIYVVLRGRARFRNGESDTDVGPGDTLFVARGVAHKFHDIREDLELLVVFGPPEGARA